MVNPWLLAIPGHSKSASSWSKDLDQVRFKLSWDIMRLWRRPWDQCEIDVQWMMCWKSERWCVLQVSFASCRSLSLKLVTTWIIESLTLPSSLALITLYMWSHGPSIHCRSSTSSSSLRSLGFRRFHSILVPCWCNFWVSHGQGFTSNSGDDPTTSYWGSVQGAWLWGFFFWDVWLEGSKSLHWNFIESRLLPAAGFQVCNHYLHANMIIWSNMMDK